MQMNCLPRRGHKGLNFPLLQARHTALPHHKLQIAIKSALYSQNEWVVGGQFKLCNEGASWKTADENVCADQARGFPSDI